MPGFLYILILYIIGKYFFPDPRATLVDFLGYKLSWVEVLMTAAAIMAMAEQIKVAKPGVNNTTEVLLMGLIAIIQICCSRSARPRCRRSRCSTTPSSCCSR